MFPTLIDCLLGWLDGAVGLLLLGLIWLCLLFGLEWVCWCFCLLVFELLVRLRPDWFC